MNVKKLKDVMDKNLKVKNIDIYINESNIINVKNLNISGFEIIKDYAQFLITSYKMISIAIKKKVDEIRIPTLLKTLKNKTDLYLIYNCLILLYENYPNKKFILEKYKYNKKLPYFIYSVNKVNKVNYLVFSYEIEAPLDKFWLYYFDNKKEMLQFIKEQLKKNI